MYISSTITARMSQHDYLLKLVLTGDKKVGKSMIVNQFVSSHFRSDYTATVGGFT